MKAIVLTQYGNHGLGYINELVEAGKIKPVIDGPYELANTVDALEAFCAGKHIGKVVITMQSERKA